MTNKQIANYEFDARITNPDEPTDHELLKQIVSKVNSMDTRLANIETSLSNFKTEITTRLDNIVKKNNLIE